MRTLAGVLVVMAMTGCASFRAQPVRVVPIGAADHGCIERALAQARLTGYVEQTVDKQMGFFRVGAMSAPNGKPHPHIAWFNVQCTPDSVVLVSAVGRGGVLNAGDKLTKSERLEMDRFAASLGNVLGGN